MLSWSLRNRDTAVEQPPFLARGAWTWVQPLQDQNTTQHLSLFPLLNRASRWRSESKPGEEVKRATSLAHGYQPRLQAVTGQFPRAGGCLAHCAPYHHIPGINSEIKQTWQRPIKLISSHFKLSISNGCFMEI